MASRRDYLMCLVGLEKYEQAVFNYIYNTPIPSTINSKSVKDKGKLKIAKIEGNGRIVNQLCSDDSEHTITSTGTFNEYDYPNTIFKAQTKHHYLVKIKAKLSTTTDVSVFRVRNYFSTSTSQVNLTQSTNYTLNYFLVNATSESVIGVQLTATNATAYIKELEIIDLTLEYGTNNEPTTLADNRIKKLLNEYQQYETGRYEASRVGEIETFDTNDISLDKITLPKPLVLDGAISKHNTLEINATHYVFTRNVWKQDIGALNLTYDSGSSALYFASDDLIGKIQPPSIAQNIVNGIVQGFTTMAYTSWSSSGYPNKVFYCSTAGKLRFKDISFNGNINDFQTTMSGTYLYYELATPQVISIPKKHLGCVDLGSLSWSYDSNSARQYFYSNDLANLYGGSSTAGELPTIWCDKYQTDNNANEWQIYSNVKDKSVFFRAGGSTLRLGIKDLSAGTNATDFKNSLAGVYLFYETEDEVADIANIIDIEADGTITSDSDILPNIDTEIKCK